MYEMCHLMYEMNEVHNSCNSYTGFPFRIAPMQQLEDGFQTDAKAVILPSSLGWTVNATVCFCA